jgi:hypothetical protein
MPTPLAVDQLRQAAAKLPRVPLAHLPTPFEEVQRFAARLNGARVFVKRDDCTGMVMGATRPGTTSSSSARPSSPAQIGEWRPLDPMIVVLTSVHLRGRLPSGADGNEGGAGGGGGRESDGGT